MSQVTVTIAGKTYRMACADGEEGHLEGLAAAFDGKIEEMRAAAGEIGDMRLHVMAAITLADELSEARRRIAALEQEMAEMRRFYSAGDHRVQVAEARFADSIQKIAERIERLARSLNAPVQDQG
ncbi:MAG TPA: cell division protein ZapA [Microvirga sp.]|jgi:cell division protein ZapA|nr:cell division protein ZapA [Microvirga sp.]